ncbi:hypothetical protein [Paraburkholderia sediminicola]|uniref:hypothetical protein n=1 Tax=Paraburkholderia sediminicola TaxID=458836 RepID=UPI0038B886C6
MRCSQLEYRESDFVHDFGQNPSRENVVRHVGGRYPSSCLELHMVVFADYDYDDERIELAVIELRRQSHGDWVLQYLSEQGSATGITGGLFPEDADFVAYMCECRISAQQVLRPFSAEALRADGLGPVDRLNLRPDNPAPVVPMDVDLARFRVLALLP